VLISVILNVFSQVPPLQSVKPVKNVSVSAKQVSSIKFDCTIHTDISGRLLKIHCT
jgi:hypothetical protein